MGTLRKQNLDELRALYDDLVLLNEGGGVENREAWPLIRFVFWSVLLLVAIRAGIAMIFAINAVG